MSEKEKNKDVRFVPLMRKVSDRAKEDLKELEEMMKQLENMRKEVIKWSRVSLLKYKEMPSLFVLSFVLPC